MLPRGDNMARGKVISWEQDVNGNPIWRENANPILHSRWYEGGFYNDGVTEITANAIAERMYAQCDKTGNDLLLIDSFIGYRK